MLLRLLKRKAYYLQFVSVNLKEKCYQHRYFIKRLRQKILEDVVQYDFLQID